MNEAKSDERPGIIEETKEVISDQDHSMGERAPGAPFAVVALSYLAVLAVGCAIIAFIIWLS